MVLGPFEVVEDGKRRLRQWTSLRRGLIARLAIARDHELHRDELLAAIWPEGRASRDATAKLRQIVGGISDEVGHPLVTHDGDWYHLDLCDGCADVDLITSKVDRATSDSLAKWRGSPLSDVDGFWVPEAQRELTNHWKRELLDVSSSLRETGEPEAARRHLRRFPLIESADPEIMYEEFECAIDLCNLGKRYAAISTSALWAEFRRAYAEKVGDLPTALVTAAARLDAASSNADETFATPGALPTYGDKFVESRQSVGIQDICDLVLAPETTLVTLAGPPGSGKSRLAVECAQRLEEYFEDGVTFIPLSGVETMGQVIPSIGFHLGLAQQPYEKFEITIRKHLQGSRKLIILDNFEHLIKVARRVQDMFDGLEVKLIITSRIELRLPREEVIEVEPLGVPTSNEVAVATALDFPAVALFTVRARSANARFELSAQTVGDVCEICRLLDGLPLGIEIAAARIGFFRSPGELRRHVKSRLGLAAHGPESKPTRSQTLSASINWSYELLKSPSRKRTFRRLAVFTGGFSLDAAIAVCGGKADETVIDNVESLVDSRLVELTSGSADETRFTMLGTIREFAGRQMGERERVNASRAHAQFFQDFGRRHRFPRRIPHRDRDKVVSELQAEAGNLLDAIEWLRGNQIEEARQLAGDVRWLWTKVLDPRESKTVLSQLVDDNSALRAEDLWVAGTLAHVLDLIASQDGQDSEEAYNLYERVIQAAMLHNDPVAEMWFRYRIAQLENSMHWYFLAASDFWHAHLLAMEVGDLEMIQIGDINADLAYAKFHREGLGPGERSRIEALL